MSSLIPARASTSSSAFSSSSSAVALPAVPARRSYASIVAARSRPPHPSFTRRRHRRALAAAPSPSLAARPRLRRGLANELLCELAAFAPYDTLRHCSTANSRLFSFAYPMARQKREKLRSLYLADVRSLCTWLRAWSARSAAIRKFIRLRVSVDSKWCAGAALVKKDLWSVNRARLTTRGMGADLAKLHGLLNELGHTLCQTLEAQHSHASDWLAEFRLGSASADQFRAARFEVIREAAKEPAAELSRWAEQDLPQLEDMLIGLCELMREPYDAEMAQCQNEYDSCTELSVQCSTLLGISLSWMK